MRICYLGDSQSIHIVRWCTHFKMLGHEVHLISFKNAPIPGIQVHYINAGTVDVSGRNWKVLLKGSHIRKAIKKIKPDVLHAHYATSYGTVGALCHFHPYIITALGTDVLISPAESILYKLSLKYAFGKADRVLIVAEHMRKAILDLGIINNKIQTITFGIDPVIFNDNGRNLQKERFVITSTRNLEPIYNISSLIQAVAKIKTQIPGLFLNLVGYGSLREELEGMVHEYKLNDLVKFYGKVTLKEIADILNRSHVYVSTSLSDGSSVSLNEAMACGALPVVTDIPANREWIKDGENGFLVPVDDPPALANKMLEVYKHYNEYDCKSKPINRDIIRKRAIMDDNMTEVEALYKSLIATFQHPEYR